MRRLIAFLAAVLILCFAGAAFAATTQINWTAPTQNTDGTAISGAITYKVYRGTSAVAAQTATTPLASGITALTYSDATAPAGTVYYSVTANTSLGESAHTTAVSVVVPAPLPNPPSGVTISVLVADNSAYKLRQAIDGFSMVAIGTVTLGTACDASHNVDGFSVVPRSAVAMASKFDTLPLITFAKCG